MDVFVDLLKSTLDLLNNCDCQSGCPACIYSPKCGNDNKPLHKKATKYILEYMCKLISNETTGISEEINEDVIHKTPAGEEDIQFGEALELYDKGLFFSKGYSE